MSPIAKPFINGRWLSPEGRDRLPVINPYTGQKIGERIICTPADVDEALQAAYEAREKVAAIPAYERAALLKRAAERLKKEKQRLAELISMEIGKAFKNTLEEVLRSIETLEISGEEAKRLFGETLPGNASPRGVNALASTIRVPVGVVAAITPFNAPLNLICHKIGPSFAAGNSTILKPAPQASLIATELLTLLLEEGWPEEAINMVLGGAECGQQIVKDRRVKVISFTGGYMAAQNICQLAGMKKVLLELGGNAATVVHDDADLKRAAQLCAKTAYSNAGQSCISVQRIYVHHAVAQPFVQLLKEETAKLKVGDPLLPDTDVGTLVDEQAASRVAAWIDEAVQAGAKLVSGGKKKGASIEPTILFNPPKESKVVCQEVFGPVVGVIPYQTIEEAISEVNDSDYGLQAGIFTNRMDVAYKYAQHVEAGGIIINGTSNFRLDHWPYGGVKNSGMGREGPRYAIEEMTETKMIVTILPE